MFIFLFISELPRPNTEISNPKNEDLTNHIPLVIIISIPSISLTFLILLIIAVCCKRTGSKTDESKKPTIERPTEVKGLHVNPLASPYATSYIASSASNNPVKSMGSEWSSSYAPTTSANLHLMKAKHWQALPSIEPNSNSSSCYIDPNPSNTQQTTADTAEEWVEVTNKANQTPSHWVYSDMITGNNENESKYKPCPSMLDSAVHSASASLTNSPLLRKSARPIITSNLLNNVASSSPALSPLVTTQPAPPSYSNSIQHLYQNTARFPPSSLHANSNPKIFQKAQLLQPINYHQNLYNKQQQQSNSSHAMNIRDLNREFFALVKANGDCDSGRASGLSNEVYARPPSEHFYFKIQDGKTEFI